jgi:hypothetical protein
MTVWSLRAGFFLDRAFLRPRAAAAAPMCGRHLRTLFDRFGMGRPRPPRRLRTLLDA